jgi:4-amino-4-deoxy-L-arabinose transferase-like glycosyltransferase
VSRWRRVARALANPPFGKTLCLIAAAALLLRVVYAIAVAGDQYTAGPFGDVVAFHEGANLLARGEGFVHAYSLLESGERVVTAEHPPLWPLVLAGASKLDATSVLAHRLVGAPLGAIAVVLIGLLGRRLDGPVAGLIAAGIAAVHPLLIATDGSAMSETLFGVLVLLALIVALRLRERPTILRAAGLGALVGVAALTRGEGLLLLGLLVAPACWQPAAGRGRRLLLAVLAACVVIAPWTARNFIRFDRPVLISTNAGTLIGGANCPRGYHGDLLGFWDISCLSPPGPGGDNEAVQTRVWAEDGLQYAADNAGRLVTVVIPVRVLRTLNVWRPRQQVNLSESRVRWVEAGGQLGFWLLVPLALFGALCIRRRRGPLWPLAAPPLLALAITIIGYGYPRFRHTADLVVVILAGVAVAAVIERRARKGSVLPETASVSTR